MLKFFRRKKDDKKLAGMAEQKIATENKMEMARKAMEKLDELCIDRRFHIVPVEFERRQV